MVRYIKKVGIMQKIVVLYLVFGDENLNNGLCEIENILNKMFDDKEIKYVVIDNSNSIKENHANEPYIITGDNSYFDFSGWDKGYSFALENNLISDETLILFANDTFFKRNYSDGENYLNVFSKDIIKNKNLKESAIGYIDDFPKDVIINEIKYNSWIRSNIFFIPSNIMKDLKKLTFDFPKERIFSNNINEFWSNDSLISNNWKAYISSWLFGIENKAYPEYKLHWLKAKSLDINNWEFFQRKAITILSEHYLTARLFNMNISIIDINIFPKDTLRHTKAYYKEQE
jgi:hypothetical protein